MTDEALHIRINRLLPSDAWSLPLRQKVLFAAGQAVMFGVELNDRDELVDLLG